MPCSCDYSWAMVRVAVIVCSLNIVAFSGSTEAVSKRCAGVEVRSLTVSTELERGSISDAKPERIESAVSDSARKTVTALALGPILGSMDSAQAGDWAFMFTPGCEFD